MPCAASTRRAAPAACGRPADGGCLDRGCRRLRPRGAGNGTQDRDGSRHRLPWRAIRPLSRRWTALTRSVNSRLRSMRPPGRRSGRARAHRPVHDRVRCGAGARLTRPACAAGARRPASRVPRRCGCGVPPRRAGRCSFTSTMAHSSSGTAPMGGPMRKPVLADLAQVRAGVVAGEPAAVDAERPHRLADRNAADPRRLGREQRLPGQHHGPVEDVGHGVAAPGFGGERPVAAALYGRRGAPSGATSRGSRTPRGCSCRYRPYR